MPKYRKKPVVIDAFQWDAEVNNLEELKVWVAALGDDFEKTFIFNSPKDFKVKSLEGPLMISNKDFIIRGIKGEYYACKPDVFYQSYEPV